MSSTQVLAVMNAMNIFGYIKTVCTADGIKTVLVERERDSSCMLISMLGKRLEIRWPSLLLRREKLTTEKIIRIFS